MPGATLHLTQAELLAEDPSVPAPLRQAMERELTYAKLGAVFPDIPFYTNIVTMMLGYWLEMPAETCPFAQKMHRWHPDLFAWHFLRAASQSGEGKLSEDQRRAILAGFFSHVALDLELHPLVNWCARRDTLLHGGHESHHHRLTEKYHSLFFHRELKGSDPHGTVYYFREKSRIVEHAPFLRVNPGLPVVRWSTDLLAGFFHESAPSRRQFASWLRAFRHFAFMVSLPMAQSNSQRLGTDENRHRYYENEDFRFSDFWERGYQRSLRMLELVWQIYESQDFSEERQHAFMRAARIGDLSYPPSVNLPPLPEPQRELELRYGLTG
jgi:hypothetical protein